MINIIPRPIRDLVVESFELRTAVRYANRFKPDSIAGSTTRSALENEYGLITSAYFMIKNACRVTVASAAVFALYKFGGDCAIAAALGSCLSLPAVVIVGGSWMLYHGATLTTAALASGSLHTLGLGLAALVGGWLSLENHDYLPFGLLESEFSRLANSNAPSLVQFLIS